MNSAFGQPAFGQSTFGQPQFGSSANNAFAPGNSANSQGSSAFGTPSFGSNSNTQQTSAFGQPAFGANSGSSGAPVFGQPSFGSNTSNPFGQTGANASPFAQTGSQPSPFGKTASSNTSSPFGQQSGNASSTAATTSPFGQQTGNTSSIAATASPFGQAASNNTALPFGQVAATAKPTPFSQTDNKNIAGTSPFGQAAANQNGTSPFGQAATSASTASPFGQAASTTNKASPFAQAGTAPSPFGQTAKTETSDSAASALNSNTTKPSIFGQAKAEDAKPSIFGQAKAEDAKPSIFGQAKAEDAKPSIFGQAKAEDAKPSIFGQTATPGSKPSIFGQSNETNDKTSNSILSADSAKTENKTLLSSPKKTAPRGLSGASPTKTNISESPLISTLEKPKEPKKPELTEKFLETLKTLSIKEELTEKVVVKDSKKDTSLIKDFKPVNFDINRSLFANNIVEEAVQSILSKDHNQEFLQYELNNFLFDHAGKKVMCKNFIHSNGNTVYFNENNEVLLFEKGNIKKINVNKNLRLENFENWQISYNGEDLLLFYYKGAEQSKFHILDIKIDNISTLKTKFTNGIKKLSWHPLANNSVVTFMTNDNELYQLNVWTGQLLHISKQILGFYDEQGTKSLRSVFDTLQSENDFDFSNITNFELSDDGWKLYLIDSIENNVYVIYPFVPLSNKMFTKKDNLEEMREECYWLQTEYQIDHHVDEIVQKDIEEFLFDEKWINSEQNKNGDEMMSCEVAEDWYLNMGVQGPMTFSNFPVNLYEHSLVDMKCISNTHNLIKQILVLLYSNGQTVVVFNTNDPVIFRNNWKTLVLDLPELQHFEFFENRLKYEIKEFLPSHINEGCLAVTKNNEVVLLNFLDIFCRFESVYFHDHKEDIFENPCETSLLLTLNKNLSEVLFLNDKDVLYFDESKNKLSTLTYPSFKYVQGREYSTKSNKNEFLSNLLSDVIHEDASKDEVKPLSNVSTSCLITYLSLLSQFQEEINKLRSIDTVSNLPLLNLSEDKPEELLSSMEKVGYSMSKALSLSYSLQTWMRICLAEFKNTLDDNLHNRLVDNNTIEELVNNIKNISDDYEGTLKEWEKRLARLQSIKEKVNNVEKLSLENERIDASVLKKYKSTIDSKVLDTLKMMEKMRDFEKDIKFLFMKLSNDLDDSTEDQGLITKLNKIQIIDENKKPLVKTGKDLLFSLGP
ncbi:hypothetical protein FOG51_00881 [Hanseniaspora uvarum]|nr:hypothetical protein FOG51_00881 [Hanseniaspora uvarum]